MTHLSPTKLREAFKRRKGVSEPPSSERAGVARVSNTPDCGGNTSCFFLPLSPAWLVVVEKKRTIVRGKNLSGEGWMQQ